MSQEQDQEQEQRRGYIDLQRIMKELAQSVKEHERQINEHEKEIAVLQEQAKSGADRTSALEISIGKIHDKLEELSDCFTEKFDKATRALMEHMLKEDKDRIKLMAGIILTLATAIASLFFELVKHG